MTIDCKRSRTAASTTFAQRMLFGLFALAVALCVLRPPIARADDFLEPEAAFRFSARMLDAKTVAVTYKIADGYYMYRERFKFQAVGAVLGAPEFPPGKVHFDDTFQKNVETYRNQVTIRLPVQANGPFVLKSTGQGCAERGLCYPPQVSEAHLSPAAAPAAAAGTTDPRSSGNVDDAAGGDEGRIAASLKSGSLTVIVPLFLLLGLGLAFTPCVLPMVPILSSIIVGQGAQQRRAHGFLLSVAYSLGMALVYTGLGVAAGLAGQGLAAALQTPWVLGSFAALMALMSLSMFGVYQLQMPAAIQTRLARASERQAAGNMAGVFAMGAISALIVGPCVAAPLASTLVYISQTRNVIIGGSALFSMAAGMSIPLLLVGLSAGSLLPRAGAWMNAVKEFFGVLMLAMALWLVAPVLPARVQMIGWAVLGVGYGGYLLMRKGWRPIAKVAGVIFALAGLAQLVGVATGGTDPWAPLAHLTGTASAPTAFVRIKSSADLDRALANANGKPALLDFYADWCVSCKEMEKRTFSDPKVRRQFAGMVLLQADVTANDDDDKTLLKRFRLFGPPGIILFDRAGSELAQHRIIGFQDADKFVKSLAVLDQ